jgi:site-specific recombinase XerD
LIDKRLSPKTINCHLVTIRRFYAFLRDEETVTIDNPVKKGRHLRLSKPLPRHLKDSEVAHFLSVIDNKRDRAMFMLMLRSGLRVSEVAHLTLEAIDWRRKRIYIFNGKGGKDRLVYISIFLVERGIHKGKPLSVRGIQKRMEYYAKASGLEVSCHHLRHTMATQLLNADAALVTIQDLLGHDRIKTTQRYCRVSNLKVQKDYFRAVDKVLQRTGGENFF